MEVLVLIRSCPALQLLGQGGTTKIKSNTFDVRVFGYTQRYYIEAIFSSLSGLWLAPPHLRCSVPGTTRRVQASTHRGCLVTFFPKRASPLIRSDIQGSLSSSEGGKWVAAAKADAPFKPFLPRLHPFLSSHRVCLPINFLSLVGLENLCATGHVPITPSTCHFSLRTGIMLSQTGVVLLHPLITCFCLHVVIPVGTLPIFSKRIYSKDDNKGNLTYVYLCSFFDSAWLYIFFKNSLLENNNQPWLTI